MAKQETKVKSKPKPKKVVSTSAIFKQKKPAAPEGKSKASHTKPSKTAAACSNKNARQTRASDRKRREEHPLSVAFSDSIEESRGSIQARTFASIDSTQAALLDRLNAVSATSDAMLEAATATKNIIFKPLSEEQLAVTTTTDGKKVSETVSLGTRMEDFRTLVDTKSKELRALWKEWTAVRQEIIALGIDVLGPEAFEGQAVGDDASLETETRSKSEFAREKEKLLGEFETERKRLETEVHDMSLEAIQKMEACEKEFDTLQRKQKKDLLSFLSTQL
ncbi:hypothetical protein MMC16_000695 [Acarospora aff. strigata]|nr:hypothetical protein [Acarospora aff. strigata]